MNGLTVYVPPAYTRLGIVTLLEPEVASKLNDAEVVLGVAGTGLTAACRLELHASVALGKHMIVMSYPAFVPLLQRSFGPDRVGVDPANPDRAEG